MGIATIGSLFVILDLLLFSVISWGVVFAALMLLFMPIAQGAMKFYKDNKCRCLDDFFVELMEDETKTSQIDW